MPSSARSRMSPARSDRDVDLVFRGAFDAEAPDFSGHGGDGRGFAAFHRRDGDAGLQRVRPQFVADADLLEGRIGAGLEDIQALLQGGLPDAAHQEAP